MKRLILYIVASISVTTLLSAANVSAQNFDSDDGTGKITVEASGIGGTDPDDAVQFATIFNNRDNRNTRFDFELIVNSRTGGQNFLRTGEDDIIIRIPNDFRIPSAEGDDPETTFPYTAPAEWVRFDGDPAFEVEIDEVGGNYVITATTPRNYNSNTIPIVISVNPDGFIQNPGTPLNANYTIEVESDGNATAVDDVSGHIVLEIDEVESLITGFTVTPASSIANVRSRYVINFTTGDGGAMSSGSDIILKFDPTTDIPNDASLSGITLNGTEVTNATGDGVSTITISSPITLENEQSVEIAISRGTGIRNPSEAGDYFAEISTEVETTPVESPAISYSDPVNLSFSSIGLGDSRNNAVSSYEIEFITGSESTLLTGASNDLIVFEFPENTAIPSVMSASRVKISLSDGFSSSPASVTTIHEDGQVELEVPFEIEGGSTVVVNFETLANLQNPSQAKNPSEETDNYVIQAYTLSSERDTIDSKTPSNPYSLTQASSTISTLVVELDNYELNAENVTYTLDFQVGEFGRIEENFNTVTVRFPTGTVVPDPSTLTVTVQGQTATEVIKTGSSDREVQIDVPDGVSVINDGNAQVVISGITNPGDTDTKTIRAMTSAEPSLVQSGSYQLGDNELNILEAQPLSFLVNETDVEFFIDIELLGDGDYAFAENEGSVFIRFPSRTFVPASFDFNTDVTVTPGQTDVEGVTRIDNRTIRVDVSRNNNLSVNTITINNTAGIRHPSVPASDVYRLQIWTSEDGNPEPGLFYTLNSRTTIDDVLTSLSATATPNVQEFEGARYDLSFTTSDNGWLRGGTVAGSNQIFVEFPPEITIPAGILATDIEVNNSSPSTIEVDTENNVLIIDVPSGLTISNNAVVNIKIDGTAGIINPTIAAESESETFTFSMGTDVDAYIPRTTADVTIVQETELTITNLSVTPSGSNEAASYTLEFRSGTGDVVSAPPSGEVIVEFDEKVGLPNSISANRVKINGLDSQGVTVDGNNITIIVPEELPAEEEHTIAISSLAGILNPYEEGNYTLTLRLPEPNSNDQSDTYSITKKISTISQPNVVVDNTAEGATTNYTISFNTGSNGRLPETGTITINLPDELFPLVDPSLNNYIDEIGDIYINSELVDPAGRSGTGSSITIDVPDELNIRNNSSVTVLLEGVINPDTPGSYTVEVFTSVETTSIESSAFFIGTSGITLNDATFVLYDVNDVVVTELFVNQPPDFKVNFISSDPLDTGNEIYIRFPQGSSVGNSVTSKLIITDQDDIENEFENVATTSTDRNNRRVRYPVTSPIAGGGTEEYTMRLEVTQGISNPSEPSGSNVRFEVTSSLEPTQFTNTPGFLIAAIPEEDSEIMNLSVGYDSNELDVDLKWTWSFTVGSYGALKAGEGRVFLQFDEEASFPEGPISTNDVTFIDGDEAGGIAAEALSLDSDTGLLTVTVPGEVNISNNDDVVIVITKGAGIQRTSVEAQVADAPSSGMNNAMNEIMEEGEYSVNTSSELGGSTSGGAVLPVELIEFTIAGTRTHSQAVYPTLYWSTATERENYGFDVYRSFENTEDWEHLTFVEGSGTTQQKQEYRYNDSSVEMAGAYYYKIVQMDYDGTTEEFGPVEFMYDAPESFSLTQNYPNPFNPVTTIPFSVASTSDVQLNVYDILGRRVRVLINEQMQPGQYNIQFNASQLASGTYFIRMVADGQVFTRKMMLIK